MGKKKSKSSKALEDAIKKLEKTYKKGIITSLGDEYIQKMDVISTGTIALDKALGVGGIPKGRIIEIFGKPSAGKTTLSLHLIAEAQKQGGNVVFVDMECAYDPKWAEKIGVKNDELLFSQPDYGEQALEVVEEFIKTNEVDLIVVDSVASLVPKVELEGTASDSHMAVQARMMSQAMRRLTGQIKNSNTSVVFINQVRENIGKMFGPKWNTGGGNALKFYSSIRIDLARIKTIKQGEEALANKIRAKVIKNKVAPPYKQAEFDIYFDEGISRVADVLNLGVEHNVVDKNGSWYSYKDEKIGQGIEKAREFLKENPETCEEIRKEILIMLGVEDE